MLSLKLGQKTTKFKRFSGYLIHVVIDWYKLTVQKSATPPTVWATLQIAFIDHNLPKDRDIYYREQLSRRKEGTKEPVTQYIVAKQLYCIDVNPKCPNKKLCLMYLKICFHRLKRNCI